jgi:methyl-accepting chemotaxis protein
MLQGIRDLSIRKKIAGFVIPSTVAFGLLMTCLALFFLNDFKATVFHELDATMEEMVQSSPPEVTKSLNEQLLQIEQKVDRKLRITAYLLFSIVIGVIILAVIGALVISGAIGKPVLHIAEGLENISSGEADLTRRLKVTSNDETGRVGQFFNVFVEKLQGIMSHLQQSGIQLNKVAASTHKNLKVIVEKATTSKELSQTVFRSAGYMSSDMQEIASKLVNSTETIHILSTAVEELSETINEISATSAKANHNTEEAQKKMSALETDVQELGKVSQDISKVTDSIAEISEQVNLLALNATIEAARAGDAGKGFAVVANEIKELAHQTAEAATEIQTRISDVQTVAGTTIGGIEQAADLVAGNTEVVATIASAVEEQSATVDEIAKSLNGAIEDLDYSNEKVSKASQYADNMADMANSVTDAVAEVDEAVISLMDTSKELKELAVYSVRTTHQFKT